LIKEIELIPANLLSTIHVEAYDAFMQIKKQSEKYDDTGIDFPVER
jgi:hypothetical protein